jgi:hypothetical protein
MADPGEVEIPYLPRRHFRGLHASPKRWKFVCAHRRAGKTVALANHLIRAAVHNSRKWPPPRYGYVGPSFDQAKDLVWAYLKQYTEQIPGTRPFEADLSCVLPHGASIKLYGGAAAYERMRGMYFDGIVLDEYPLLNPAVFSTVVRPCLADYGGFAIVSGTSNGDDHFHQLKLKYEDDPRWDVYLIPLSATGEDALSKAEALELTQDMSSEEYAREMECSFEAPVEGSYYGEILNKLAVQGRITSIPVDLSAPAVTAWDLGIHDFTSIWTYQICGKELHFIDYLQDSGKGLDYYAGELQSRAKKRGYRYRCHCLPHDVEARELGTGQSRKQVLDELVDEPIIVQPMASIEDGISAARGLLGISWFDAQYCKKGLSMLRGYRKNKMGRPVHGPEPYCVEGDTLVLTRNGAERIKDMKPFGEVWTPVGWKRYREPRITRTNAPLVAVSFGGGLTVNCTAEHLFLTASGWKSARNLAPGSEIRRCSTPPTNISTASFTGSTKASAIFQAGGGAFMSMFGKLFSARAPKEPRFTIAMAIPPTTLSTTSNACLDPITPRFRGKSAALMGQAPLLASAPPSGIAQRKGALGIAGTPPRAKAGKNGNARSAVVHIAAWFSWLIAGRFIAPRFAKAAIVESVTPLARLADVWCLTVDDPGHWWCLANGAITHNSHGADAYRTAATTFHMVGGLAASLGRGRLRRRIRGVV